MLRCSLLCLNLLCMLQQRNSWKDQYGYAMYAQLDFVFSFLLVVILVLRGIFGPLTLPFHQSLRIVYRSTFAIIALISFARFVVCLLAYWFHWNTDGDGEMQGVVLFYFFCESITWSLQMALNISLVADLRKKRDQFPR
jgi:uncharacterized membrane protein